MKYSRSAMAIGLVGCLLALPLVETTALQEAQPPVETSITDWNNLRQLRVGDKVEVVRHNLGKHKGKVLAWTEESISLRLKNQDVTIPREEVYRVTWLSKSRRGGNRNVLIGLALGAAVGAVAASAAHEPVGAVILFSTPLFIGIGVGAVIPSHPTIYRAPRGTD